MSGSIRHIALVGSFSLFAFAHAMAAIPGFDVAAIEIRGISNGEAEDVRDALPFINDESVSLLQLNYAAKLLALRQDIRHVGVSISSSPQKVVFDIAPEVVIESVSLDIRGRMRYGKDDFGFAADYFSAPAKYGEETTRQAAFELTERLREIGYLDAVVVPRTLWLQPYRGKLILEITPGHLYRVEKMEWVGPDRIPPGSDLEDFGIVGRPMDTALLQQEFDKYIVEIRELGYLDARGEFQCNYDPKNGAVCRVGLITGPHLSIGFVGNTTFYAPDLLATLDLDVGQRYSVSDLSGAGQKIEEFYRQHGFYGVVVTAEIRANEGELSKVLYNVSEGERREFRSIRIEGFDKRIESELIDRLNVSPSFFASVFRGKERKLSEAVREAERHRIEFELQRMGFLNAMVKDDNLVVENGAIVWQVHIASGSRYYWDDIELPETAGTQKFDRDSALTTGLPVDLDNARTHVETWLMTMRHQGYLDAAANLEIATSRDDELVSLRVETYEGPKYTIAYILVDGAVRTKDNAIRSILPLRQGDDAQDEKLADGRRVLLERRVFRQANSRWVLREPSLSYVVGNYQVVERNGGEIEIGLLLTTGEGAGFDLRLSHNRMFGTFRSLRLAGSTLYRPEEFFTGDIFRSQPYLTRWGLRYREPIPSRRPLFGDFFGSIELNRNDRDIEWLAQTLSVGPSLQLTANLSLSAGYIYEWFKTLRIKQVQYFDAGIVTADRIDRLGGLRFSLLYENFDDKFDPQAGWGTFQDIQYFDETLGGEHALLRYEGNFRYIQELFGNVSLWLGVRGGAIGAETSGVQRIRSKVFRLGGSGSVRGYARDVVSPYAEFAVDGSPLVNNAGDPVAIPVGGKWFANLQTELRFAITDSFEIAAFEDNAVIGGFSGGPQVNDRVTAAGYGAGILYHTPAGPLRLDVGKKIIDLPTDPESFAVHFYVSTTF